jgi:hypothetical protein
VPEHKHHATAIFTTGFFEVEECSRFSSHDEKLDPDLMKFGSVRVLKTLRATSRRTELILHKTVLWRVPLTIAYTGNGPDQVLSAPFYAGV